MRQLSSLSALLSLGGLLVLLLSAALLFLSVAADGHVTSALRGLYHFVIDGMALPAALQPLWQSALPRMVLVAAAGMALGMAGATLQGMFRSPLGDPTLTGGSAGAALLATVAITLLRISPDSLVGTIAITAAATLGAGLSFWGVYRLTHLRGRQLMSAMVLLGLALNATAFAVGEIINLREARPQVSLWTAGLGAASWTHVAACLPFILLACAALPLLGRALDAVLLGDAQAQHLGFSVRRIRLLAGAGLALAVGGSVAAVGVIGFLGLTVPHLARALVGSSHRVLLPGSALLGATLLLLADVLAHALAAPTAIPTALVVAALGAPCFAGLILFERLRSGGV